MGGRNKLLERIGDVPMVTGVLRTVLAVADPVLVVTGHQRQEVQDELKVLPVDFVHNPRWEEGMSTSIAAGVGALAGRADGVLICLADMPEVQVEDLRELVHVFRVAPGPPPAIVPVHGNQQGNPVLWSARLFPELQSLTGDRGAKALLKDLGDRILRVPAGAGVLLDADTPEAFARLRGGDR
jgi:molybdenum cofactor cytidylyltransferase